MQNGITRRTNFRSSRLGTLVGSAAAVTAASIAIGPAAARADVISPHAVTPQVVTPHVVAPAPTASPEPAPLVASIDPVPPSRGSYGENWGTPSTPEPGSNEPALAPRQPGPNDSDAYRQVVEEVEKVTELIKSISIAALYGGPSAAPDSSGGAGGPHWRADEEDPVQAAN
jgi:hypothetical protein